MDKTNTTTNWIIAGLVTLVIIIAGGWLIGGQGMSTSTTSTSTNQMASSTPNTPTNSTPGASVSGVAATPSMAAAGETVTVMDQPAGSNVIVVDVNLKKPSWVAIRDTHDWILGAAWFNESQKSVVVSLMRPTVAGQTYQAVIYADDGDKKFTLHAGDTLLTSTEGAPVSSTFTAK